MSWVPCTVTNCWRMYFCLLFHKCDITSMQTPVWCHSKWNVFCAEEKDLICLAPNLMTNVSCFYCIMNRRYKSCLITVIVLVQHSTLVEDTLNNKIYHLYDALKQLFYCPKQNILVIFKVSDWSYKQGIHP